MCFLGAQGVEETMDEEKTYWRVGLFVCLSLLAAAALWWLTGPGQLGDGTPLRIQYNYTGPIKAGALARLSGLSVGRVQEVKFIGQGKDPEGPMVELAASIQPHVFEILSDETRFYVTTMGVLGEYYLDIEPRQGKRSLKSGEIVRGVDLPRSDLLLARAAGFMEVLDVLLVDNRKELIAAIEQMTQLVRQGHRLLEDPEGNQLMDNLNQVLLRSRTVIDALAVALGDGKSTKDTLKSLPIVLKKVREWEQAKGEEFAAIMSQTAQMLSHADSLWKAFEKSKLKMPQGAVALAQQTDDTLQRLESVSRRAENLLKAIENKEGAAGELWHDPEFAKDLKALIKVLRHNPKSLLFK